MQHKLVLIPVIHLHKHILAIDQMDVLQKKHTHLLKRMNHTSHMIVDQYIVVYQDVIEQQVVIVEEHMQRLQKIQHTLHMIVD